MGNDGRRRFFLVSVDAGQLWDLFLNSVQSATEGSLVDEAARAQDAIQDALHIITRYADNLRLLVQRRHGHFDSLYALCVAAVSPPTPLPARPCSLQPLTSCTGLSFLVRGRQWPLFSCPCALHRSRRPWYRSSRRLRYSLAVRLGVRWADIDQMLCAAECQRAVHAAGPQPRARPVGVGGRDDRRAQPVSAERRPRVRPFH